MTTPGSLYAGEPALHRSARLGAHETIRALVKSVADLEVLHCYTPDRDSLYCETRCTPLMVAAGSNDGASVETVQLLLSLGADPKHVRPDGSAAERACTGFGWDSPRGGDVARVRALISAGGPLRVKGRDALELVSDTASTGDAERLRLLIELGAPVNWDGDSRWTPLACAASAGSGPCVELLLKAGADARQIDGRDQTALFSANSAEVVRLLVAAGVDVMHWDGQQDALDSALTSMGSHEYELTELEGACAAMVEAGLPLVVGTDRVSRLYSAITDENVCATRWLIEAGHDLCPCGDFPTALHAFCCWMGGWKEIEPEIRAVVRLLIHAGLSPTMRDAAGCTPLHHAIAGDGHCIAAAEELLNAGADINARNNEGQTPLVHYYESRFQYAEVVPFLLKHGANPLIPNTRGKNAIDIARQMIAGGNPDWRAERGFHHGWKHPAKPGDEEHQMLALMLEAAERFR